MRALWRRFTDVIGLVDEDAPAGGSTHQVTALQIQAIPQVEPGSTLDVMMELNPEGGRTYADALVRGIAQCSKNFQAEHLAGDPLIALEQLHSLKNLVAAIGAPQLNAACEALRLDVCRRQGRSTLGARYQAIACAAQMAIALYMRDVPTHFNNLDDDGRA